MATERKLERDISRIYQSAGKDMAGVGKEWRKYFKAAAKELKGKEDELQKAKESGDKKEIAKLERELREEKQRITTGNAEYRKIVSETTDKLADANQNALNYINGEIPSYYTESYNAEMKAEAVDLGFRFDMADEATVKRLITDGDIDLPKKKIDVAADKRWNTKYINSQVTQGIVQGESMDKIADRIFPEIMAKSDTKGLSSKEMSELLRRNKNAAIRNARTLVNGAENKGRQDRYRNLAKQGAVMKRIWTATGDERTRDWHLEMDGQEVDLDEPFVDGNNNKIDYPGDPHAAPETVYNCRCTTKSRLIGFRRADGTIVRVDYDPTTKLHKEQIQAEIKRRQEEEKASNSKGALDGLSEDTKEAIADYTTGEEMHLNQRQFDEITDAMQVIDKPMYRVESVTRTAERNLLEEDDEFDFSAYSFEPQDKEQGALRSFAKETDALPDLLGQVDDAVIFETTGEVSQLPIESLSQFDQAESLVYAKDWEVVEIKTTKIGGKNYQTYVIRKTKPPKKKVKAR